MRFEEVKMLREPIFNRMSDAKDIYNGDFMVPLPQMDKVEKPAVANLIMQGIDQYSMRVASVTPNISFPILGETTAAVKRAADQRRATQGWWRMNRYGQLTRRRARHFTSYGMTIVSISPMSDDPKNCRSIPHWRVRNPLSSYPAPMLNPDAMEPEWCIFRDRQSMDWVNKRFPDAGFAISRGSNLQGQFVEVLEYVDDCETCLVAVSTSSGEKDWFGRDMGNGARTAEMLMRVPNRIGVCPVVIAGRITLDRMQGAFDQTFGAFMREAKLDSLNTIAIQRNIFADEWAVSSSNSPSSPRVIKRANGRLGEIGIIDKGVLQWSRPPMNQEIPMALDRYERNIRITGGIPADWGGESGSNMRTARRASEVTAAATDMSLQEAQEALAASAEIEIELAIRTEREYYGEKKMMFYFGKDGKMPKNDYVPNELFNIDLCTVAYPMPGSDAASSTVQWGQMVGVGELSLQTLREMDPRIADAELEKIRVDVEALEKAFNTGVEQGAAQQTLDPVVLAKMLQKVRAGMDSVTALIEVHEEMQKAQADQQQQQQQGAPGQPPSPDQQPGMVAGTAGQNMPPPPPGAAPPGAGAAGGGAPPGLSELLSSLGGANAQQGAVSQAPAPAPAGV